MANVGVIGLGAMGAPMARNLLKGGHAVTVFAAAAEKVLAELQRRGGAKQDTAAVFSVLANRA
jgi:3-hydroxyisobutyrate dehydrogenase-like beta-hydroxyacid dehydrogenase